jgi:hypothetical protein
MHSITSTHIRAAILLLGAASCRAPAPSPALPDGAPDLTGQVVDARIVRTLGGAGVTFGRLGGTSDAEYIQRLRVRVVESRSNTPVTDAIVGIDGITVLVRSDSARAAQRPELPGAYVRIWFRGVPNKDTPVSISGMARRVVVDSVASAGASK